MYLGPKTISTVVLSEGSGITQDTHRTDYSRDVSAARVQEFRDTCQVTTELLTVSNWGV